MHICAYSGGHSSAIVAIEVARRFGKDAVILLNHNINHDKEHKDIKRFKQEVADYLGLPITYANCLNIQDDKKIPNQFEVCIAAKAFKVANGTELCTNRLKTAPFHNWLTKYGDSTSDIIYYGFDVKEKNRIVRRQKILQILGYASDYPLALWPKKERTIHTTSEIGIKPPLTYATFKHGNCIGCLKAGLQHWYIVYCQYPDIWQEAKEAEEIIGHSIHAEGYLEEIEPKFEIMYQMGVMPTEKLTHQKFWAEVYKLVPKQELDNLVSKTSNLPCECAF